MLPISIAPPWGIDVGDMLGHLPLPAKITVEALAPIELRASSATSPTSTRSTTISCACRALDALAAERRWPVLG